MPPTSPARFSDNDSDILARRPLKRKTLGLVTGLLLCGSCAPYKFTQIPGEEETNFSTYSRDGVQNLLDSDPPQDKDGEEEKTVCEEEKDMKMDQKGVPRSKEGARERLNQIKTYVDQYLKDHPKFRFPELSVYIPYHDPKDEGYLSPGMIRQAVTKYCQDVDKDATEDQITEVMVEGEPLKIEDIASARRFTSYVLHLRCDLASTKYDTVCKDGEEVKVRRKVNGLSFPKTEDHPAYIIVKALPTNADLNFIDERFASIALHELGHREDDERFGLTEKEQSKEYDAQKALSETPFRLSGIQAGDKISGNQLSETTGDSLQILAGGYYAWQEILNAHKKSGTLYQGKVDILNGIFFDVPGSSEKLGELVSQAVHSGFLKESDRQAIAKFNYILAQEGLSGINEMTHSK